ncbi:sn-glycerol-3-phosphate ABC transporter ATP-binding protein UgpC [Rhabdaerophilum sp. SD176]|uniref:ABC transporter ATP-binding protein n=1 Tax=Rhabdaerophilum sp. SD176 TaxID=2983548 RepID=UPI0024DFEB5E|nr:sn-glycerol-3-phosphate ABC transporter ATP-binding protein UgpC [Rhabdaerophilum sp. SD176]
MAGIEIAQVVKAYGSVPVIHGIDLSVRDGEFVVLVGPSGCGKSTLLRMIAGLESVTGGTIRIGDRVVNDLPPRDRDIAMVFQDYALYPHRTVAENVGFGLRMRGVDAATIARKVNEAAEILQITHLLDRKPGQLSGGQRQRVAMGRAIVRDPKVFLFDEPLSNLDAQLRAEMRVEIKKLHQRFGTTIIYVTHDQVEAMTLADRIAILKAGHVEQFATPDEVYRQPRSTFVARFIGSPAMNIVPAKIVPDATTITLAGGASVAAPASFARARGRDVLLGLRAEHLRLAGAEGVPARTVIVEPLGSDTLALMQVGAVEMTGRFPPSAPLRAGGEVALGLDLDQAHLFDPETGLAIV